MVADLFKIVAFFSRDPRHCPGGKLVSQSKRDAAQFCFHAKTWDIELVIKKKSTRASQKAHVR